MVKRYATHDFDQVLGLYYAKARFYDAADRKFTSVDPVKGYVFDPITIIQYLYVKNSPLNFIDPLGEYYIKKTSDGQYQAIPESETSAVAISLASVVPFGTEIAAAIRATASSKAVGGNSITSVGTVFDYLSVKKEEVMADMMDTMTGAAAGTANIFYTFAKSLYFWTDLGNKLEIPTMDYYAFALFAANGINPKASSIDEVNYMMLVAYSFISALDFLFLDPAYHEYHPPQGFMSYYFSPGPTVYMTLHNLNYLDKQGKSEAEIQERINEYWKKYSCSTSLRNKVIDDSDLDILIYSDYKIIQKHEADTYMQKGYTVFAENGVYLAIKFDKEEKYYLYAMNNYKSEYQVYNDSFKSYYDFWMDLYSTNKKKRGGGFG